MKCMPMASISSQNHIDLVKEHKLIEYFHNGWAYGIKEIQAHTSYPQLDALFHQGKWFMIGNSRL